jgi:Tfp pilus assembly protein PilF
LLSMFRVKQETAEEFLQRMAQLEQDMEDLDRKQPQEVAGDHLEPVYYGRKLQRALNAGDEETARHLIEKILQSDPTEVFCRLAVAIAYQQLGEEAEAMAQLGIALGLHPGCYAAHILLARLLVRRGDRQAAEAILQTGWAHHKKHVSRKTEEAERARYFAVLDESPTR